MQRVSRRGERRDYFRAKVGAWDEMMRRELESIRALRRMAERGLRLVEGEAGDGVGDGVGDEARGNLEEMREFYAYWEE